MLNEFAIECKNLTHYYGKKRVFENLNFNVKKGRIFGLLGKNGIGKTTVINILNGYLKPYAGECLVFGENSQKIFPTTKARIGFLMEGHIQYGFMNIHQIEKFYSAFFQNWQKGTFFDLMAKLDISAKQKISTMSCGQRSLVALGLVMAQNPDLMILDDYSMGLDAGYRRLFLDYLKEYTDSVEKTIFITSHIIQDLEKLIDDFVILDSHNILLTSSVKELKKTFKHYKFDVRDALNSNFKKDEIIKNFEVMKNHISLYTFLKRNEIEDYLHSKNINFEKMEEVSMTFEDAFIGITGKY